MPKTQNQPLVQPTQPDVVPVQEKPQETEVPAKEAQEKQQSEETAE